MALLGGIELNPFSKINTRITNIIILCTGLWILTALLNRSGQIQPVMDKLMFHPDPHIYILQPWSILTYVFLHAGFMHLFFNMLWLYFVGQILESMLGSKHIWRVFLFGGMAGAGLYMLVWLLFPSIQGGYMLGASAGVLAIVVAAATHVPEYRVYLFGVFAVKLVWIAVFSVVMDFLSVSKGTNTGGYLSHLSGAFFGFIYVLHQKGRINIPYADSIYDGVAKLFSPKPKGRPVRVSINPNPNIVKPKGKISQEEIDAILDKINQSGYESLSPKEKEKLFRSKDEF